MTLIPVTTIRATRSSPTRLHIAALAISAVLPAAAGAQTACTAEGSTYTCQGAGNGITGGTLDNATINILPGAVISGGDDRGFNVDDGNTITNQGTITSTGDHAVQGDNDMTVINRGIITGGDGDGVNIDNDGTLINSGTITGGDDGVQLEENANVLNELAGTIQAVGEAVNVNTDNAIVTNHGTIIGGDDGINAAENAVIVNTGTILSNGGAQDGVDLDSGSITNSGSIRAEGSEDGIDFDISSVASSITNTGTVEGNLAINNDPGNTAALSVVNAGTLIGRSGVAIDFGAGDDVLEIAAGSQISGAVAFGTGNDTLIVQAPMAAMLSFDSAPETIQATGPYVAGAAGLISLDAAALSFGDDLALRGGLSLSQTVLERDFAPGTWVGGHGFNTGTDGYSAGGAGLLLGHDFSERYGAFLSLGTGGAETADGVQEVTQRAYVIGLRGQMPAQGLTLSGTVFAGVTRTELDSPDAVAGQGKANGTLAGASLRAAGKLGTRLDFAAQLSVLHHGMGSYSLTGAETARIAARDATTAALRLELGAPMAHGAATLRPFAALTLASGSSDDIAATAFGDSTQFAAADWQDGTSLSLGASYAAPMGAGSLNGRIEVEFAEDRDPDLRVGFGLTIPFGG